MLLVFFGHMQKTGFIVLKYNKKVLKNKKEAVYKPLPFVCFCFRSP
jgi:hypothetical protein